MFDAKGKEGETDLGVHFGFAPQIQCGGQAHDCFGAQIDMRQVFLTVGGTWGQILAGREIGLFNRQNILTDQTLFGVGATGGISTAAAPPWAASASATSIRVRRADDLLDPGRPADQFSIGLFEPSSLASDAGAVYDQTQLPRRREPSSSTAAATSRAG